MGDELLLHDLEAFEWARTWRAYIETHTTVLARRSEIWLTGSARTEVW